MILKNEIQKRISFFNIYIIMEIICRICKLSKNIENFTIRSIKKNNKYYTYPMKDCKTCRSQLQSKSYSSLSLEDKEYFNKNRYKKNSTKIKENSKKYYNEKKSNEEYKEKRKQYYIKNKESISKKSYLYKKNRMLEDSLYKLKNSIRCRLLSALKGYGKKSKTEEIIGCRFEHLLVYIESLFIENMSWENRGIWEIDHIVPLSMAKNYDEVVFLSNYRNLQPLWSKDNREKSNKFDQSIDIYQDLIKLRKNQ